MSKLTIARPYAKAAFDFAVEHQVLDHWQLMLSNVAALSHNDHINKLFFSNITIKKLTEILFDICGDKLDQAGQNFISIMADNKRLWVLPNVLEHFMHLRAKHESTIEVSIITSHQLKEEQLKKISMALEKRFSCTAMFHYQIDTSILAGIIIIAGDIVIDGSIRGRIERLSDALQY